MDLRAPLPAPHDGVENSNNQFEIAAPHEDIVRRNLCQMYAASRSMELGAESRFTGLVLFHRYARRFLRMVQEHREGDGASTQSQINKVKNHLGSAAAACLFLGCKMEEEPQRIRDVINLSHVLNFSSSRDATDHGDDSTNDQGSPLHPDSVGAKQTTAITILESSQPPPLDESYWTAKEQMVSTEQHVLRMIQFDTTVCHPHRCVLIIMETLGFGVGIGHDNEDTASAKSAWLLKPEDSERIISRSCSMLNEASLDPSGSALQYPVLVLSCASITLATNGYGEKCDANKEVAVAQKVPLPGFWWRALDVPTDAISSAREALLNLLHYQVSSAVAGLQLMC